MNLDQFLSSLNEGKVPKSPLRDKWAKAYIDVYTHASGDKLLLQKVVDRLRPSEAEEVKKYRVETIEPVTKEPIYESFGIIKSVSKEHSGKLKTESQELKEFTQEDVSTPCGIKTFDSYWNNEGLETQLIDANGYHGWLPVLVDDESVPAVEAPDNIERKLKLVSFLNSQVIHKSEGVAIFVAKNKWKINGDVSAPYYWYYDTDSVYRVIPTLISKKIVYQEMLWYEYNLGKLPVRVNGGFIRQINEEKKSLTGKVSFIHSKYYVSFLDGVIPIANDYIQIYSDAKVVYSLNAHPLRVITPPTCHRCRGQRKDPGNPSSSCTSCDGSGYDLSQITSIAGMVIQPKGSIMQQGADAKPVFWIHPPTETVNNFRELEKEYYHRYKMALQTKFNEGVNESGESRKINRQSRDAFVGQIIENNYDMREYLLQCAEGILVPQPSQRKQVIIERPLDYSMPTPGELLEELKELSQSDAPVYVKGHVVKSYSQKVFANDVVSVRINDYLHSRDPLYGASDNDVMSFVNVNVMDSPNTKNVIKLHSFGHSYLMRLSSEIDNFLDLSDADIDKILKDKYCIDLEVSCEEAQIIPIPIDGQTE